MTDNPILDEVYAARQAVFNEAGGTLESFCAHYSVRRPGVLYADMKPVKPRLPRKSSRRSTSRRKKAETAK